MDRPSIELLRVSNGVVIRPGPREPGSFTPLETTVVFDDLKALQAWVADWWHANNLDCERRRR